MFSQQANSGAVTDMEDQTASVLDMRAAGFTYRQIATELGVDVATAHRRVQRELEQQRIETPETHDDVRDLDLAKIAWLERRIMSTALDGDLAAARFVLACIRCRRQYYKEGQTDEAVDTVDKITSDFDKWLKQHEQFKEHALSDDDESEVDARGAS